MSCCHSEEEVTIPLTMAIYHDRVLLWDGFPFIVNLSTGEAKTVEWIEPNVTESKSVRKEES